mmetsp:Transcript_26123/g.69214  ORF Transcript_26123/g.69214 Transcript_26123/m.69214 type:complete len:292 (+) Transcript_26123:552-1427(+)
MQRLSYAAASRLRHTDRALQQPELIADAREEALPVRRRLDGGHAGPHVLAPPALEDDLREPFDPLVHVPVLQHVDHADVVARHVDALRDEPVDLKVERADGDGVVVHADKQGVVHQPRGLEQLRIVRQVLEQRRCVRVRQLEGLLEVEVLVRPHRRVRQVGVAVDPRALQVVDLMHLAAGRAVEHALHHDKVLGVPVDRDAVRAVVAREERARPAPQVAVVARQQRLEACVLRRLERLNHEAAVERPEEEAATLALGEGEDHLVDDVDGGLALVVRRRGRVAPDRADELRV